MPQKRVGLILAIIFSGVAAAGTLLLFVTVPSAKVEKAEVVMSPNVALAARFDELSQNGNSSCSGSFTDSIATMPEGGRLQGSCCSPMSLHRYIEQTDGLKKYKSIPEIPPDPYDVDVGIAKKMILYYDTIKLTPEEQKVYDYAMEHSDEKGPCCCKCWRWYVYGGLGKYLIKNYGFTGEQVTDVWNFSDGCGGDGDHLHGEGNTMEHHEELMQSTS